jgi:YVTN family beta-propeller protein
MYIVDSPTGFVLGAVIPVSTAASRAGSPISVGEQPRALAMLPGATASSGSTLYVVNIGSGSVTPVSTATREAGPPIPVGYLPTSIAIAR